MKSFSISKFYSWTSSSSTRSGTDKASDEVQYDGKATYRAIVSSELAKLPDSFIYMDIDDEWDDGCEDDRATDITGESSVTAEDIYAAGYSGITTSASSASISAAAVNALLDFTDESMDEDSVAHSLAPPTPLDVTVSSPTHIVDHSDRGASQWNDGYVAVQLGSPTSPPPVRVPSAPPRWTPTSLLSAFTNECCVLYISPTPQIQQTPRHLQPRAAVATTAAATVATSSSRRAYGFHQNPNQRWQHYCDSGAHELLDILQREKQGAPRAHTHAQFNRQRHGHAARPDRGGEDEVTLMLNPHRLARHPHGQQNRSDDDGPDDDVFASSKAPSAAATEATSAVFVCDEGVSRRPFAVPHRPEAASRRAAFHTHRTASSATSQPLQYATAAPSRATSSLTAMEVDVTETPTNSPTSSSPPSAAPSLLSRLWSGAARPGRPQRSTSPPPSTTHRL